MFFFIFLCTSFNSIFAKIVNDELGCQICTDLTTYINDVYKTEMEEQITKELKEKCPQYNYPYDKFCSSLVDVFVGPTIQRLEQGYSVDEICRLYNYCDNKLSTHRKNSLNRRVPNQLKN